MPLPRVHCGRQCAFYARKARMRPHIDTRTAALCGLALQLNQEILTCLRQLPVGATMRWLSSRSKSLKRRRGGFTRAKFPPLKSLSGPTARHVRRQHRVKQS